MDPGYRTPVVDFFRRGGPARDARLLAARGAMPTTPAEQLALLVLLSDDADGEVAAAARATLDRLPEAAVRAFLQKPEVPDEMRQFFAGRGIVVPVPAVALAAAGAGAAEVPPPAAAAHDGHETPAAHQGEASHEGPGDEEADDDEDEHGEPKEKSADSKLLSGLPIKKKIKLASKGTREQRAQLIRDPNKLVSAAVLASPKLTETEVEAFAKMGNVSEEVLRVIGTNRGWLKSYSVVLGLVRNPKTPLAISMQLMQRVTEKDLKMLAVDRNVPESLRLAARKFIVKGLK